MFILKKINHIDTCYYFNEILITVIQNADIDFSKFFIITISEYELLIYTVFSCYLSQVLICLAHTKHNLVTAFYYNTLNLFSAALCRTRSKNQDWTKTNCEWLNDAFRFLYILSQLRWSSNIEYFGHLNGS